MSDMETIRRLYSELLRADIVINVLYAHLDSRDRDRVREDLINRGLGNHQEERNKTFREVSR